MANKVRDLWLWSEESAKYCPPRSGFKPETRTVEEKVRDLIVSSYVCVDDHPCKIVEMGTPFDAPIDAPVDADKLQFIAMDIFDGEVFKATFPLSGNCVVPLVTLTDFQLVDISEEDSQVTLLDDKGNMKFDLKLPTDEDLHSQIKLEFDEGKDVFVCVGSAMGKEQIIAASRRSFLRIHTEPIIRSLVQLN